MPLAPVRATGWLAKQIAEEAEREMYDEDRIRRELLDLELEADEEDLSPEERAHREDELLIRLATARKRRLAAREPRI